MINIFETHLILYDSHRDSTPAASHPSEAVWRPASLLTLGTFGVRGQVTFPEYSNTVIQVTFPEYRNTVIQVTFP